ncbi:MAG TPA: deoxyribodipyrimidine photolyase [Leptospiraceae bacterium]|nr:deoxyribodipyrimidine photolyase [Leptospiraceae bacterium]HMW06878.1 deoxyribodipyrimidine photolyase [Leptospiraceae bacterium]HMX34564.1 deoxyribodipyrimidine photolyase [Leptospiraceae bacterium]HMY32397.1 deoxyribodipyrimidine photolyase [Leptospiraceae bacterium]HMZ65307.1 deoxyribodipyrimidine photolyase [Leptospiraceae bacterium]
MISSYNQNRNRDTNQKPILENKTYVLYWMQAYRRMHSNHALDYAISISKELQKELVIYEGLRMDYRWNSKRFHKFILEGMCDNREECEKLEINYWSFVETNDNPAKGLLKKIAEKACIIITDDFPSFIIPEQIEKLANKIDCKLIAVDSNSIIPISLYGEKASAARVLRPRVHKLFAEAYIHQAKTKITKKDLFLTNHKSKAPFKEFSGKREDIEKVLSKITFSNHVEPVRDTIGGSKEAAKKLSHFIKKNLNLYGDNRSNPQPQDKAPVTGLSPYLHFGHISVETIVTECLNADRKDKWAPDLLNLDAKGDKDLFFGKNLSLNSFFDELLTWRDIGYLFFFAEREFHKDLKVLPDWLQKNLEKHAKDKREFLYKLKDFEAAETHDPLWNAAQKELVLTGRMHNYMRMLWGKKIIEWTATYKEAFEIAEELNNKYAYDGRNPNSYTGILWCFGLFDRPWFPERNVFGTIRFMSSDSTKKKFKMKEYLEYVDNLDLPRLI